MRSLLLTVNWLAAGCVRRCSSQALKSLPFRFDLLELAVEVLVSGEARATTLTAPAI